MTYIHWADEKKDRPFLSELGLFFFLRILWILHLLFFALLYSLIHIYIIVKHLSMEITGKYGI